MGSYLLDEPPMWDCVKSLSQVQVEDIDRLAPLNPIAPFFDCLEQLCGARPSRPEAVLGVAEEVLGLEMCHQSVSDYSFQNLAWHGGQTYWPVVAWVILLALLVDWHYVGKLPVSPPMSLDSLQSAL